MILALERDAYLRELDVEVLETGEADGRPWAVLSDTICYPEGGGQPADHGVLGEVRVVDVRHAGDTIRHFLERPVPPGEARLVLDWERRHDHMQHHTGQHLLSAIAEDAFGWTTTSFHLKPGTCDVELDAEAIGDDALESLEEAVNAEVRAARAVRPRRVSSADLGGLDVRTRGLPPGHAGDVRLVEIEGIDLNTCGGTHLRSTAEIEALCLLGAEALRGGTRVHFVAGRRLRRRLGAHERRNARLRDALDATDEELPAAADARIDQVRDLLRQRRDLLGHVSSAVASALVAASEAVVAAHLDDADVKTLQAIARRVTTDAPGKSVLLTAGRGEEGTFLVAAGPESGVDVAAAGRRVAEILDGRGGGRGTYQGRARNLSARSEALGAIDAPSP